MDSPQITHLSLCSGYGGIDLGLRRCVPSLRTLAYAEIEAFAIENLLARMEGGQLDAAPIWTDLKTFPWGQFHGLVDILSGGYPCQPFSAAGKRLGKDDPRHLWPWIADGIRILKPRFCFFENVEGHVTLGLRDVLGELESMGYRAEAGLFSAAEVGAGHQRKRIFILAYRDSGGSGEDQLLSQIRAVGAVESPSGSRVLGTAPQIGEVAVWPALPGQPQFWWEPLRTVANTPGKQDRGVQLATVPTNIAPNGDLGDPQSLGRGEGWAESAGQQGEADAASTSSYVGDSPNSRRTERGDRAVGQPEAAQSESERPDSEGGRGAECETQPPMGGDFDGVAGGLDNAQLCVSSDNRTDELRLLGNGVVPATAAKAFRVLINRFT